MKILLKYLMLIALLLGVVSCDWGNIDNKCRDDAEYYFGNLSYGDTPVDTLPGDRFGYDFVAELPSGERYIGWSTTTGCHPQSGMLYSDSPIICKAGDTIPAMIDLYSGDVWWGRGCESYITFKTNGFQINNRGTLRKGLVTFTYELYFDETDRTFSGERNLFVPDSLGF